MFAVRRPDGILVIDGIIRDLLLATAVGIHHVYLPVQREGDPFAVRRPCRESTVYQQPLVPTVRIHQKDISVAVEGDRGAVGRPGQSPIAVFVVGQLPVTRAIGIHQVDLGVDTALRMAVVSNVLSIRGPRQEVID